MGKHFPWHRPPRIHNSFGSTSEREPAFTGSAIAGGKLRRGLERTALSGLRWPITNLVLACRICVALMILILVAACGSDSSSPGTDQEATDLEATGTSPETDQEALTVLYRATNGPNWLRNSNWLTDAPLEDWYGVSTDEDGRVTKLELPGNELSGAVPLELGKLDRLQVLDLTASRTMTRVSITIGGQSSKDGPASGRSDDPTDRDIERLIEQSRQRQDTRDPISRAIDQMAEQASDPENTRVERNYLSGCIPTSLREQLDIHASDLGGLPFCDEMIGPTIEADPTDRSQSPPPRGSVPTPRHAETDRRTENTADRQAESSVSAGGTHTCGLRNDGSVEWWGGSGGQATPPSGEFASVSVGNDHTCGVMTDGSVQCWGSNEHGQSK